MALQVRIHLNGKTVEKDFNFGEGFHSFIQKLLKKQKETVGLTFDVISPEDEDRRESLAWEDNGKNELGIVRWKCVEVPKKKGLFYCPHCHGYKKMAKLDYDNGLEVNGCPECEMSEHDFYIKTANGLWGK